MSEANNSNFTRGAQLWAHNMRMALQGIKNICLLGLAVVFVLLSFRMMEYLTLQTVYYLIIERYTQCKLSIGSLFYHDAQIGINFYSINKGHFVQKNAEEFIHQFWYITPYSLYISNFLDWLKQDAIEEIMTTFSAGCFAALILFNYRGHNILGTRKLRGSDIVTVFRLRWLLKKARQASKIKISGLPLVKNSETQHLLLTGTTGAGKTNMLNELLTQIRLNNERAIIFDVTGEFVDRFYNSKTDSILNPLREDSVQWLPWNDCKTDEEYNNLAAAFVDGESIKSDRYWEDAARSVLVEALKKQAPTKSIKSMMDILARAEFQDFCQYFSDTDAAGYVSKEADKGAASVRSTLTSKIERLKYLKEGGEFSIKDWVNDSNEKGWLFVTAGPNDLDTLRTLISVWANISIKGIFDRPHSGKNEKMWFIMDELPAMQKIPSLSMVLSQGRKYGACVVAGIQNIAQLERIYGRSGSQELLDLFRTKFFFAVSDNDIAEYASRYLGEIEISETKESLSYGSNTMRDGVNINSSERIKRLVLPDEIKNLPTRTCFVKLCGNYPITKLKVDLQVYSKFSRFYYRLLQLLFSPKKLNLAKKPLESLDIIPTAFEIEQKQVNSSGPTVELREKEKILNKIREKK
ncbi:MAG: type IV secretion system DNA-binding domain-containing protein [Rickettsiaceae bacterium]|nr:type IV secretion system DNA-binding domain-containing protein [Rickettsiaceae bacterium]